MPGGRCHQTYAIWKDFDRIKVERLEKEKLIKAAMILTTTPTVEGRQIREYKGVVFGEVVNGVNFRTAVVLE